MASCTSSRVSIGRETALRSRRLIVIESRRDRGDPNPCPLSCLRGPRHGFPATSPSSSRAAAVSTCSPTRCELRRVQHGADRALRRRRGFRRRRGARRRRRRRHRFKSSSTIRPSVRWRASTGPTRSRDAVHLPLRGRLALLPGRLRRGIARAARAARGGLDGRLPQARAEPGARRHRVGRAAAPPRRRGLPIPAARTGRGVVRLRVQPRAPPARGRARDRVVREPRTREAREHLVQAARHGNRGAQNPACETTGLGILHVGDASAPAGWDRRGRTRPPGNVSSRPCRATRPARAGRARSTSTATGFRPDRPTPLRLSLRSAANGAVPDRLRRHAMDFDEIRKLAHGIAARHCVDRRQRPPPAPTPFAREIDHGGVISPTSPCHRQDDGEPDQIEGRLDYGLDRHHDHDDRPPTEDGHNQRRR